MAMSDRAASTGHDLLKKSSPGGASGFIGVVCNNGASENVITTGPDSCLKSRFPVLYRNYSVSIRGYPAPGTSPWLGSEVLSLSLGGTEIIQGTGTIRCIDSERGIFGIITSDGTHYLPSSLPEKYAHDGINIEFKAYKMPIISPQSTWGNPVRIISIAAEPTNGETIECTGTVTWVPLEGGFYGIVADDGKKYDPLDLPEKYAADGFRIMFTATEEPDMVNTHMWGTIVTITDVSPASGLATGTQNIPVEYIGRYRMIR